MLRVYWCLQREWNLPGPLDAATTAIEEGPQAGRSWNVLAQCWQHCKFTLAAIPEVLE